MSRIFELSTAKLNAIFRRANFLEVVLITIVLLGIALTFRVSFDYFFAQDDFLFLGRLAQVHSVNDILTLFLRNDHFYRPMSRVVMLGIPYALFGTSVTGYHLFMLCLHLTNTVLLYRLLREWGARFSAAVLSMCVYGFYPVHFMPVVWISAIQELSATFFVLVTALAFCGWRRKPAQPWRYGVVILAYMAAVLSKEVAILLPVLLLVIDLLALSQVSRVRITWRYFLPYLGLLGTAMAFLIIRSMKADVLGQGGPYAINLTLDSIGNNFKFYALDMYSLQESDVSNPLVPAILTIAVFGALLTVLSGSRPWLIIGAVWFLCFLTPTLILGDRHYSYYFSLPSAGVAVVICGISEFLLNKLSKRSDLRYGWLVYGCLGAFALLWIGVSYLKVNTPWADAYDLRRKGERAFQIASDFKRQIPRVAPGSTLYVTGAKEGDEAILEGLFNFYAPALGQVVFDPVEPAAPSGRTPVYVFQLPPASNE